MMRNLVLVHGRAQEKKDAVALKGEWLRALSKGLAESGLVLPTHESDVRFPFYGDTLSDMVGGKPLDEAAAVIVRGKGPSEDEETFTRAVLGEVLQGAGVTPPQIAEVTGQGVARRGPLNWEWVQGCVRAIDRLIPYGSGASIALFTHDVYQYLMNSSIRETIDAGVGSALTPGIETVVVAHSLGTVVAYNLLRQQGHLRGWKVPVLVTVGSPLAITVIRKTLRTFAPLRCPPCVTDWFNAMDERDVVALYPLDVSRFPLDPANPAIANKTDVRNETANRHGIAGYLNDAEVARRIHDALVG